MKQRGLKSKVVIGMMMLLVTEMVQAGIPLWSFTPVFGSLPQQTVSSTGTATVQYTVTNNSSRPHNLVIQSQTGISQTRPCALGPKGSANSSCMLTLSITGSALPVSGITGGPVLCQANPNGTPGSDQCYQPSQANSLNITVTTTAPTTNISVSPTTLSLTRGVTLPSCVTVTNLSTSVAVQSLVAAITPGSSEVIGGAIGTTCASTLVASGTCSYCFLPGAQEETGVQATFSGSNTSHSVPVSITVSPASSVTLTTSSNTLALSVKDATNHPALTGNPRQFTISNGSTTTTAYNVTFLATSSPANPNITSNATPNSSCGDIAPLGTCIITIAPTGATPTTTPHAAPVTPLTPITLTIKGDNTNTLTPTVNILTYGNVYQSGYIYAINDTTPNTGSIGGTVVETSDNTGAASSGIYWDSTNSCVVDSNCYTTNADSSSNGTYSPTPSPGGNTYLIYNVLTLGNAQAATSYAAGLCTGTISGLSDWYLPAICEMGYGANSSGVNCGTSGSPALQNMKSNLINIGNTDIAGLTTGSTSGSYWSSTESSSLPQFYAWIEVFSTTSNTQYLNGKYIPFGVRCSRALTL